MADNVNVMSMLENVEQRAIDEFYVYIKRAFLFVFDTYPNFILIYSICKL